MSKGTKWLTTVGRNDLPGFDRDAKKLIVFAVELGAQVRISSKGHAILRGPDGKTVAVPRSLRTGNRGGQNAKAAVKRMFRA